MAHPDIESVRVVDKLQKAHDGIEIVKRLADAHKYDVGDGDARVKLRENDLIEHLRGRKVTHAAGNGRSTECAAHAAADLRGDADGISMVIAHENAFDAVAVGKLPEVFDRSVEL